MSIYQEYQYEGRMEELLRHLKYRFRNLTDIIRFAHGKIMHHRCPFYHKLFGLHECLLNPNLPDGFIVFALINLLFHIHFYLLSNTYKYASKCLGGSEVSTMLPCKSYSFKL